MEKHTTCLIFQEDTLCSSLLAGKTELPLNRCYKTGSALRGWLDADGGSLWMAPLWASYCGFVSYLIQIASCSFNEVAIQLGGVFLSDWKYKSGSDISVSMFMLSLYSMPLNG